MLESLIEIGEIFKEEPDILTESKKPNPKKEQIVLKIIFDFDKKQINYDKEKFVEKSIEDYNWIGHTFSASQEKVARLTFQNPKYFPSVITNTREKLQKFPEYDELVNDLRSIENIFLKSNLSNELTDLLESSDYANYDVVLFTICVKKNGNVVELAKTPSYVKALKYLILPNEPKIMQDKCHICGQFKEVLVDPAFEGGTLLKIYVVDQPGYMSGISNRKNLRALRRTFAICADCRYKLIVGEKTVSKKFSFRMGRLPGLFIPKFKMLEKPSKDTVERMFNVFQDINEKGKPIADPIEIKKSIETLSSGWYSFSLLFGKRGQANFVYFDMIQEVPMANVEKLREKIKDIADDAVKMWNGDYNKWKLTLNEIASLIPRRKISGSPEYRTLLQLTNALLKGYKLPRLLIYELAALAARTHRFQSYNTVSIEREKNLDISLVLSMIKFNYLMLLMENMEALEQDREISVQNGVQISALGLNEKTASWIERMNYKPWMIGMFLLGYLIGEIGYQQSLKGDEKKSILEKIDFKGMKWERIERLLANVIESLKNYRILKYNELIYHYAIKLINESRNVIANNNPIENLFYILTGYSFATYSIITHGGKNE